MEKPNAGLPRRGYFLAAQRKRVTESHPQGLAMDKRGIPVKLGAHGQSRASTAGKAAWAVAALAPLALAAGACSAPQSQSSSMDTNQLTFADEGSTPQLAYTYGNQYSISSGQPWGGVTGCGPTNPTCTITVQAGRQQTGDVSSWFQAQGSGSGYCTKYCGDWPPSALNFAITGTLQIDGTNYPLAVAQGSESAGMNNWWFTGPGWNNCQANLVGGGNSEQGYCTPDGRYMLMGANNDSIITVWQVQ